MKASWFVRGLRAFADEVERAEAEERETERGWVSQTGSPLGARRHAAAVRRRLERGERGAGMAGRKFLLSSEALAEELAKTDKGEKTPKPEGTGDRLRRKLALVGGGR